MSTSHVLVIDDSERFAVHVWRCISGYPGFGHEGIFRSGDESDADQHLFYACVDDGCTVVWWIRAGSTDEVQKAFVEFINKTQGETVELILLDRVGRTGKKPYSWHDVHKYMTKYVSSQNVHVVSAYRTGMEDPEGKGESLMTTPKLQSKLVMLLKKYTDAPFLEGIEERCSGGGRGDLHVLVTGAGFEIGSTRDGLGQPSTWFALESMWKRLSSEGLIREPIKYFEDGWPLVEFGVEGEEKFEVYAKSGDLDEYFSWIFHTLRKRIDVQSPTELAQARNLELNIRRSFRSALLQNDWGQLYQCGIAARLPWLAWISTNYTGFADRAIEALPPREGIRRWEIIGGAEEARRLYDQMLDEIYNRPEGREESAVPRLLFKVHGDIGDVRTMALAKDDKRADSFLLAPVQSLYSLYGAAQQFLMTMLAIGESGESVDARRRRVVFHIVGHNLFDRNLLGLLVQTNRYLRARGSKAWFVIVNPDIFDPRGSWQTGVLTRLYEGLKKELESEQVLVVPSTAREYMSRLGRNWSELYNASNFGADYSRVLDLQWKWRKKPDLEKVKRTFLAESRYKESWRR